MALRTVAVLAAFAVVHHTVEAASAGQALFDVNHDNDVATSMAGTAAVPDNDGTFDATPQSGPPPQDIDITGLQFGDFGHGINARASTADDNLMDQIQNEEITTVEDVASHSMQARGGGNSNRYYYYYTTCNRWRGYCPSGYYKARSRTYCNPYGYGYYYPSCEKVCCYQYSEVV